jgi:hypothetical protein
MDSAIADVSMVKPVLRHPALQRGMLIACTAVGAVVLFAAATLALLPLVMAAAVFGVMVVAALLIGWGGIEGMAALERWLENDARFQR